MTSMTPFSRSPASLLLSFALASLLAGCASGTKARAVSGDGDDQSPAAVELRPCQSSYSQGAWNTPFETERVELRGDKLVAFIRYQGGCESHRFYACFSAFLESSPVQAPLDLGHESTDTCSAPVTRELHIDLLPLREAYLRSYGRRSGTVAVAIPGGGGALYKF